MDLIQDFSFLYYRPSLEGGSTLLGNNKGGICLHAHKDRVGFFVLERKSPSIYIVLCYGTIEVSISIQQTQLYSSQQEKIISTTIESLGGPYYAVQVSSDAILSHGDFLQFSVDYTIDGDRLTGPYLDNIIGIWTTKNILATNPNIDLIQAIDEEASLQYTKIQENYETVIVIDTIWQGYIKEPIDYDKIYVVNNTSYSSLTSYTSKNCVNIDLKVGFALEPELVSTKKIYYILCPIMGGHIPISRVKISTCNLLLSVIKDIIDAQA